ncbi:MAG: transposase [Bacteroidales bacterium]|jgi:REP element-mobilizing transposase RayT|nr:transposase [Bacteroidales bacterium]
MSYNPEIHHRRSIRLKGYDYSHAGLYFVTICTQNRECLFGKIRRGGLCRGGFETHPTMILNEYGKIVETVWNELPQHYYNVKLNAFVVMPNHIHGIIALMDNTVGAGLKPAQRPPTQINDPRPAFGNGAGLKPAQMPPAQINDPIPAFGNGAGLKPAPTEPQKQHDLSEIIRALKTFSARRINELRNTRGAIWQRNYYEHIIRNDQSYQNISDYILNNPSKWTEDTLYHE